ncbi:hypothetical protein [Radicibacter daui]|uniref:hypothetical protein n=1 Tax=Radicibacter daui TaxID=3064829 RepID=UPI004046F3A6
MKLPLLVRMPLKEIAWSLAFGLAAGAALLAALVLALIWLYHRLLAVMTPDQALLLVAGFLALIGAACAVLAATRRQPAEKAPGPAKTSTIDPAETLAMVADLARQQPLAATSAALLAGLAAGASPSLRQGLADTLVRLLAPPPEQ